MLLVRCGDKLFSSSCPIVAKHSSFSLGDRNELRDSF